MDTLIDREFFGFEPEKVYDEVYAIYYNEFLQAAEYLRDTLLQVGAPSSLTQNRWCLNC